MTKISLAVVKRRYPSALYSYMRIVRPHQVMTSYLAHPDGNPTFIYPTSLNREKVLAITQRLQVDSANTDDPAVKEFLKLRLKETALLSQFVELKGSAVAPMQLATYRAGMQVLYGTLDTYTFNGALSYIHTLALQSDDAAALAALQEMKWEKVELPKPDERTFWYYRTLLQRHLPDIFAPLPDQMTVQECFERALTNSGLAEAGWTLRSIHHAANVAVSRHRKTINIGENYLPTDSFRLGQIIAHEVYGHARRFNLSSGRVSGWEEEGIALLYEQLLAKRFTFKRMLRYIALSLAWGADGKPRDFHETYRLMVPLVRVLLSDADDTKVRQTAFKEVLRAFRGGNPNIPGMILLKDKIYLESNLKVWRYLTDTMQSEASFAKIVDGYESIPERKVQ